MRIEKGKEGTNLSWQKEFPEEVTCICGGTARIAFVAQETDEKYSICALHDNKGAGEFWPHDYIAVAVYFCRSCFLAVTRWNQA